MVTAMELGFPFLRDGMLIATDGVPPLHADESGGASHCEGRGAACSVGLPKGQPSETCGVEMLWHAIDGMLSCSLGASLPRRAARTAVR